MIILTKDCFELNKKTLNIEFKGLHYKRLKYLVLNITKFAISHTWFIICVAV